MKGKIIMDYDLGHGDAIALILTGVIDGPLEILAVATVAGNQSVSRNTTNALNILDTIGRQDIAVTKDADRPLTKPATSASEMHEEFGLDDPKLPSTPSRQTVAMPAPDMIIDKVMTSDTPATIAATGPLTNVAMALIRKSKIAERIESITLMGGDTLGSWTPVAEPNIWVGTEAVKRVFEGGITINVFGLGVAYQVLADNHMIERFENINNPVVQFVVELLQFFKKIYKTHFNIDGGPIRDACTILHLLQPELSTMVPVNIDIGHQSPLTYDTAAADLSHITGKPANAYFVTAVDVKEVWNLMDHKLRTYE